MPTASILIWGVVTGITMMASQLQLVGRQRHALRVVAG